MEVCVGRGWTCRWALVSSLWLSACGLGVSAVVCAVFGGTAPATGIRTGLHGCRSGFGTVVVMVVVVVVVGRFVEATVEREDGVWMVALRGAGAVVRSSPRAQTRRATKSTGTLA